MSPSKRKYFSSIGVDAAVIHSSSPAFTKLVRLVYSARKNLRKTTRRNIGEVQHLTRYSDGGYRCNYCGSCFAANVQRRAALLSLTKHLQDCRENVLPKYPDIAAEVVAERILEAA